MTVKPLHRANYEVHWGPIDYKGKVILDIGADYGSTADFFLRKGAMKVIAVERDQGYFERLCARSLGQPEIVPVSKDMVAPTDFLALLEEYDVDIMKVDCEGCEALLLELDDDVFSRVPEYLIEVHPKETAEICNNPHPYGGLEDLRRRFLEKFERCGFEVVRGWAYRSVWVIHAQRNSYEPI